jgi:hypothetical protein
VSRRPPSRAWRILRPWHTRRGRIEPAETPPTGVDVVVDDWPGPDLSPSTSDMLFEDEIRAEIEAKRRARERGAP